MFHSAFSPESWPSREAQGLSKSKGLFGDLAGVLSTLRHPLRELDHAVWGRGSSAVAGESLFTRTLSLM